MKVHISFDKAAVERQGRRLEDVHRTVKTLFAVHDLPCTDDSDALVFQDRGHGDDFAVMWDVILSLLRADWFWTALPPASGRTRTARRMCLPRPERRVRKHDG